MHHWATGRSQGFERAAQFGRGFEAAVWPQVVFEKTLAGAGDVACHRVEWLHNTTKTLGRACVNESHATA